MRFPFLFLTATIAAALASCFDSSEEEADEAKSEMQVIPTIPMPLEI